MCTSTAENRRSVAVPGFSLFRRQLFGQIVFSREEVKSGLLHCQSWDISIPFVILVLHTPDLTLLCVCSCPLQHLCSRSGEVLPSLNGCGSQVYLTSFPQLPHDTSGTIEEKTDVTCVPQQQKTQDLLLLLHLTLHIRQHFALERQQGTSVCAYAKCLTSRLPLREAHTPSTFLIV